MATTCHAPVVVSSAQSLAVPGIQIPNPAAPGGDVPPPPGRSADKFHSRYTMGRLLGMGSHSVVRSAFDTNTGEEFACKCLRLLSPGESPRSATVPAGSARPRSRDAVYREIWMLHRVQGAGSVSVREFYEEGKDVYVVMERVKGQELMAALLGTSSGHFSEAESRDVAKQLLQSLAALHDREVVHRDLKFENIVRTTGPQGSSVKIIDFGLAAYLPDGPLVDSCGTPFYTAPEVLKNTPYGTECDLWSLGVILFAMLSGHMPFFSESMPELFEMIMVGEYTFSQPAWEGVSPDAKDLVKRLLSLQASERICAQDALLHPWISSSQ
mmetsp:Transcript_40288/g.114060  ORF Transcript_40288/g.114060 Transcript_40288/m.114060 type:complete len:326 (+) Transcript_40288:568-1545(+)|eukprot:CAMPEP_0117663080 /NCGR_PEP_ID=MMETSP0804-20121206/8395_1 /TAXON_ID=1074897 /ORGANISM="Tetraselmis astigmatica, Strain CCMP880" /LENGTH=325 /DNA_ID=CAMNT_0005470021 /DNA_START=537 /DNA_END=1514 /DNA_ORIENTATION=-